MPGLPWGRLWDGRRREVANTAPPHYRVARAVVRVSPRVVDSAYRALGALLDNALDNDDGFDTPPPPSTRRRLQSRRGGGAIPTCIILGSMGRAGYRCCAGSRTNPAPKCFSGVIHVSKVVGDSTRRPKSSCVFCISCDERPGRCGARPSCRSRSDGGGRDASATRRSDRRHLRCDGGTPNNT